MISLLDLNIWNYNEPWARRRELIAQTIQEESTDLVALQEVTYLGSYTEDAHHQADQLLARVEGYHLLWQPAMYYVPAEPGGPLRWEGLAIFSRLPILDRRHVWLSRDREDARDRHQRIVLGARVLAPRGPFWFFTTHLSLSERARERTIQEVHSFVEETVGLEPWAITGDFNARPHETPTRYLTGEETLRGQRGRWVDAWAQLHPGEPGDTHSAWEPTQRIDYLFVPQAERVISIAVAANRPDAEGLYPSDHLGLAARLEA